MTAKPKPPKEKPRILFVEDDPIIRQLVKHHLEKAGYECELAEDGDKGHDLAFQNQYDAVLVDLGLPLRSGIELIEEMRSAGKTWPIIVYTALDDEQTKISSLELGADDHILKPTDLKEIVARIEGIMRHSHMEGMEELSAGGFILKPARREVYCRKRTITLSIREFQLLYYLGERVNKVVPKKELLEKVWGYKFAVQSNIVEIRFAHLQRALKIAFKKENLKAMGEKGFTMKRE